jgi:hypothetical protein
VPAKNPDENSALATTMKKATITSGPAGHVWRFHI